MEYGVHLPQIAFGEPQFSLEDLIDYANTAERLGFRYLCANDHLLFSRPWLDGPTAIAALISHCDLNIATTISLPVVRNPVALAKTLGAIDRLSGGRLIVGLGAGSSERDYNAVGIPLEERWPRFDESIRLIRALWHPTQTYDGEYYSTEAIDLQPGPDQENGPPIWIGSWGSKRGLRRVAHLGDGWLASGYNTTPERFADGRQLLEAELSKVEKDPTAFPTAIATMFFHVTEDMDEAYVAVNDWLAPVLDRPADELVERLPIGPPAECAKKLASYQASGVDRVFLWPIQDIRKQLQIFQQEVIPAVD